MNVSKSSIMIIFISILSFSTILALGNDKKITEENDSGFSIKFTLSKHSAVPGDTIWFIFSLVNHSNDSIKYLLPTPLPVIFTVFSAERPVWRSDYGMMFAQIITPFVVEPGDSIPLRAFWLGKNNNAQWLPLGKYYIEGCFTATKQCLRDSLWLID